MQGSTRSYQYSEDDQLRLLNLVNALRGVGALVEGNADGLGDIVPSEMAGLFYVFSDALGEIRERAEFTG